LLIYELPRDITDVSDVFSISFTPDYRDFYITPPGAEKGTLVRFSVAGLRQLEHGLKLAGLEAKHFQWPPWDEPTRLSDRGIQPFEEGDAGIFFGREERIGSTLDLLRGFRKAAPPRLMIICGAQGVGKSSFLRAGLIPRLARDDGSFWIFPVIRPNQAALYGRSGLIASVRTAVSLSRIGSVPDEPHRALRSGSAAFRRLLNEVVGKRLSHVNAPRKAPMLVLCVDQAEELLTDEGRDEAKALMKLLRDLIIDDDPAVVAVLAIRSELYPRLQEAQLLNGIETTVVDLEPCAGHLLTHQHRTSG
jgi:hypothetical protein